MTVTSHGLQGFVLFNVLLRRWGKFSETTNNAISGAFGFAGMLSDIIPAFEVLRGNYGGLYVFWHDFSGWSFVPTIGLHQIVDWLTHTPGGGWAWFAYPLEVLSAVIIVLYFLWFFRGSLWAWVGGAFGLTWLTGLIASLVT
jgi:hypothetical protein